MGLRRYMVKIYEITGDIEDNDVAIWRKCTLKVRTEIVPT